MEYIKVPLTSKSLQRLFKSDSKLNLSVNIWSFHNWKNLK
jgi:hypothetical protein